MSGSWPLLVSCHVPDVPAEGISFAKGVFAC